MFTDIDMRRNYNHGFWQGSCLTALFMGVITLGLLYFMKYFV